MNDLELLTMNNLSHAAEKLLKTYESKFRYIVELESQLRESNAKLAGLELALEAAEKLASHFEQEAATYKAKLIEHEQNYVPGLALAKGLFRL